MEVLKSGDSPSLVTNIEVMQLLSERIALRKSQADNEDEEDNGEEGGDFRSSRKFENRDWIEETVYQYLKSSPCGGSNNDNNDNNEDNDDSNDNHDDNRSGIVDFERMPRFVSLLRGSNKSKHHSSSSKRSSTPRGYELTDAETLQILNHLPSESVEIHLLIEDLSRRMDESRQQQFLNLIADFAGRRTLQHDENLDDTQDDNLEEDQDEILDDNLDDTQDHNEMSSTAATTPSSHGLDLDQIISRRTNRQSKHVASEEEMKDDQGQNDDDPSMLYQDQEEYEEGYEEYEEYEEEFVDEGPMVKMEDDDE